MTAKKGDYPRPESLKSDAPQAAVTAITDVHFSNTEVGAKQCKALSLLPKSVRLDGQPVTEELLGQLSALSGMWYLVIKNVRVDEADIA